MGIYSEGLVGESHYQREIRACHEGEMIRLIHEIDNKYDREAIVARTIGGATIGYLARDSWLKRLIFAEQRSLAARIQSINGGSRDKPSLGVVLTIATGGEDELRGVPAAASKSWLSKLLGF